MSQTITVDGDEVIDATIDGEAVEEITIDGVLAWAAGVGLDGLTVTRQDGSYTASNGEHVVSNGGTITFPSPVQDGIVMVTKVETQPELSGTVDGISEPYISGDDSVVFVSDGNKWYSVDRNQISAIPDSVVSRPTDGSTFSSSEEDGLEFEAKADWPSIGVTISANSSGFTRAYLRDSSNNLIQDVDISSLSAGDTFTFDDVNIQDGDIFRITIDAEGSSYTVGFVDESNYPYTSTDLDIIANQDGQTEQQPRCINDIGNVGF